eukprot:CAMPEP_0117452600 /NCGR_PEP_ID=MMETSP0759-20121206/9715_1 /TAXON_ID=63605 /ORGANISM="Percolomonas cosmopolitus, Strain WS" /LENGTH=506 /DNA_ID=CAMNT_0005245453 /DNA_START=34 /DNA_END=1551 /DNA_ORIENTATION=-
MTHHLHHHHSHFFSLNLSVNKHKDQCLIHASSSSPLKTANRPKTISSQFHSVFLPVFVQKFDNVPDVLFLRFLSLLRKRVASVLEEIGMEAVPQKQDGLQKGIGAEGARIMHDEQRESEKDALKKRRRIMATHHNLGSNHLRDMIARSVIQSKYQSFQNQHLCLFYQDTFLEGSDENRLMKGETNDREAVLIHPNTHSSNADIPSPSIFDLLAIRRRIFIHANCQWTNVCKLMPGQFFVRLNDSLANRFFDSGTCRHDGRPTRTKICAVVMREMDEFLSKNLINKHEMHHAQDLHDFVEQNNQLREFILLLREKKVDWVFVHHKKPIAKEIQYLFAEHGMLITNVATEIHNICLLLETQSYTVQELLGQWHKIKEFPQVDSVQLCTHREENIALLYCSKQRENYATLHVSSITHELTTFCAQELLQLLHEINTIKKHPRFLPPAPTILARIVENIEQGGQSQHLRCIDAFVDFCQDILLSSADDEQLELFSQWSEGLDWMITEAAL